MFKWFNIAKRLAELEDTCHKIEREHKNQQLEWDAVYEKFRLLNMRLSKRVQQLNEVPQPDEQPAEPEDTGQTTFLSRLTPRQQEINRKILLRRRGNGVQ